ncbi:Transcription factor LHW [Dichanthelium oligosanthes]|uniref:Transcription factor LHW n=1 Tax=Dichanthelium oligosanthes TaxID=888268 RepID=A0A1E5VJV3_9POAL|nr:Transcription factor LHW [Dichanthelium oligosanthes]
MAGALGALCRAGGWSYAAIWRSDRRDPRLLTIGECHCEDEARKVVENMVNQVHVVGEGVIGGALISGEYQWISDDIPFSLSQISDADNLGLFQDTPSAVLQTIAVVPIQAFGVAQFGSMQKVSESLEFLDQVRGAFFLMESISWHSSTKDVQKDAFTYNPQFQLNSPSTSEGLVNIKAEPENTRLLEDTITVNSLKNFAIASNNRSLHSFNGFTSNESCSGLNPHIVAMPVNSKSISTVKLFQSDSNLLHSNISENALQIKSTKQPGSSLASAATSYSSLANLPRIEHGMSCTPNKLRYCLQNEKSSRFLDSHSSILSTDAELKSTLFDNDTPIVQSHVIQEVGITGSTSYACELHELRNEIWGEAAGSRKEVRKQDSENNGLLESTAFDPVVHDWWNDTAVLAGNTSHFGATGTNSVAGQASSDPLSIEERGLFSESIFEELLGFDGNVGPVIASSDPLAGSVSSCRLPRYNLQDSFSVCNAQVPALILPSISCTSENVPIGASKATPVSLQNLSMDDCGSLKTANSKVSQVKKPEGAKVVKKRARPGESTRPRPKDRQQIQERVKELREIVPNSAKCSIDALLDRTIKHMLFLQSVTKYAEKIKQADEPKMISKDSSAVLNDNSSGVVLKDDPSAGSNGGATWAYEVAGQTMVCPIIVEDLAPPGQMLVEMLCEERGFFLEIADTIRGFGLTILKGLMELRDGKIMARFLVEANKNVTRMDIFLSLVQLLQQNSLNRSSDQLTKVINNGVPSFAEHQQSPISIPVGLAGR